MDQLEPNPTIERMAVAIARHAASLLKVPLDIAELDIDSDFFSDAGCTLGSHPLDSMDLLDVISVIEDRLDVFVLAQGTVEDISTLRRLAALIVSLVEPDVGDGYTAEWAALPTSATTSASPGLASPGAAS